MDQLCLICLDAISLVVLFLLRLPVVHLDGGDIYGTKQMANPT